MAGHLRAAMTDGDIECIKEGGTDPTHPPSLPPRRSSQR
jgi:hypothetical protein